MSQYVRMCKFAASAALLIGGVLAMAGCEPKSENPLQAKEPASIVVNPAGVFPITNEPTTLRVMVMDNNRVENFATNEFTKWLEEKTNLHIEWEVVPDKNAQQKLNLALASGDYPDVFLGLNVKPVQQALYGKDGVFLPMNRLIEQYGVETKRVLEQAAYAKEVITAPDGNIYSLPLVNDCYHCLLSSKMWINQAWLTRLGLPLPTTTEAFEQVLQAFKDKDPNGNGKADELPLVSATNAPSGAIETFLMESFVQSDTNYMFIENGKIQAAYNQPGWKQGLLYLRELYQKGLIATQSFTQDRNQLRLLGENPAANLIGAVPSQNPSVFSSLEGTRWKDYVAVAPLQGPGGWRTAEYNPYRSVSPGAFIITDKAKSPEAAFRLADLLYSEEAAFRGIIGRPEKEWTWAGPGDVGIDGKPAKWKQLANYGKLQNAHWPRPAPLTALPAGGSARPQT
ncbi:extracellular solute-binding protein [Paenibacillus sp. TAB 01]|uniref:extracellular solute-binding protein n=1 Tax=Paenibacillus sp. TAB 01 TaxID=3368988 RepID=UPI0037533B77